ncbi:MAG: isopentenyl-diphosphate Delta-isomerase [Cyclobacteriaceae bacterium]|jgi:isopentenyl-diphosphate delta-isomerase|nr:isopentenyl-diphosphate Delta-isomerase [Cyclobacteriaceae bacterium]
MEHVILVDVHDREIGTMEKIEAHRKGALHRAFSIMVFNSSGEVLLQKRAQDKYHSGGLWTNACCSHPNPGDEIGDAISRKLMSEMGITLVPTFAFKFLYRADVGNGLIEHEYDHVYSGTCDTTPSINPSEVEAWKFMAPAALMEHVEAFPNLYTPWFRIILSHPELVGIVK